MAIDSRNYDLDELRAASVGQPSLGGRDEWPGEWVDAAADVDEGTAADDAGEPNRPAAAVAFETAVARNLAALDGDDAAESLDADLSGINVPRADAGADLDADDHRVSLHYVARLASFSQR